MHTCQILRNPQAVGLLHPIPETLKNLSQGMDKIQNNPALIYKAILAPYKMEVRHAHENVHAVALLAALSFRDSMD
jgi:hypothetical protein